MHRTRAAATAALVLATVPGCGNGPQPERFDADGDGLVTRDEARAHPELREAFTRLDRDMNGVLDAEELSAF